MDAAREQAMSDCLASIKTDIAILTTEVRLLVQRVDPMLADFELRIRALEQRPAHEDLPERIRDVEKWQWKRDAALALGSSGVGGTIVALISALSGVG